MVLRGRGRSNLIADEEIQAYTLEVPFLDVFRSGSRSYVLAHLVTESVAGRYAFL